MHQEPVDVHPAILLRHRRAVRQERKHRDRDAQIAPQRRQPEMQLNKRLGAPGTDFVRIGAEAYRAELLEVSLGSEVDASVEIENFHESPRRYWPAPLPHGFCQSRGARPNSGCKLSGGLLFSGSVRAVPDFPRSASVIP